MIDSGNDFELIATTPCQYAQSWPDVWETLTPEQGRVLSQVFAGYALTGRKPTRTDAEALADFMNYKIDEVEFGRRVGRNIEPRLRGRRGRRRRYAPSWSESDEL